MAVMSDSLAHSTPIISIGSDIKSGHAMWAYPDPFQVRQ